MSSKNFAGFLIFLAVVLIILSYSAAALSEDFSVTSQKEVIGACSCGLTATTYTVRNIGSVASSYEIFKSGNAAPYSTFSESFFMLEPGQSKDVINYISLPCDAIGSYSETINITTAFASSKSFEQEIDASKCANFDIIPVQNLQSSCPGSPVAYQIFIRNTGSYDEVFDANVTSYPQYASLSENSVLLRPNENRTITAYFNFPYEIYGEKDLSVDITAERSGYLANVPLKLNIRECYDYTLTSESSFNVCEGESASSLVTVENQAEFSNTFYLDTTEKYASVENNSIFLWPNQSGSAALAIDASELAAGDYSFDIVSTSDRGDSQKAVFAGLTVEKCRDFDFSVAAPDEKIIASKNYDYVVTIENTGTRTGNFSVSVEGPEWMMPESSSVVIAPGEKKDVMLSAEIPSDFSGRTYARVTISEDFVVASKRIDINAISVEKAYSLKFKTLNNAVRYNFADINVSIQNTGVDSATYELSLEGPEWTSLAQNGISLAPGEERVVSIQTSPGEETAEGKYAITLSAVLPEAGIGYSSSFNVKLYSAPFYQKAYNFIAPFFVAYWLYIVIVIAAIIVLILLIWIIKKLSKKMKERSKIKKEMEVVKVMEEKPPATYQPSFQPFVTPTIIPEEAPKLSIPKVKAGREFNWGGFFRIFFIILVIAGVIALVATNWGFIGGLLSPNATQTNETNKSVHAPEFEINRSTGIEGEGNVVYIRADGTIDIPVMIKNKADAKVAYSINNENSSWITADRDPLSLDINETKTMHLFVNTTPSLRDGTYEISLGLNINESGEEGLKYSDNIELRVRRGKPLWEKYLPYGIAGIVLMAIFIMLIAFTRKSMFDIKKSNEAIQVKRVSGGQASKGIALKIILIIIAALVVAGTAYYVATLPVANGEQGNFSLNLNSPNDQTREIGLLSEGAIIPFIFTNNFNMAATYDIETSADWIAATDSVFVLPSGNTRYVNVTAIPNSTTETGIYNATIKVSVPSEGISYTKTIIFNFRSASISSLLLQNRFFVIGVAIIVVGILLLLVFKKRKAEKKEFLAEIRQEIEIEKSKRSKPSKTNIKLKAGRPKKQK